MMDLLKITEDVFAVVTLDSITFGTFPQVAEMLTRQGVNMVDLVVAKADLAALNHNFVAFGVNRDLMYTEYRELHQYGVKQAA